MGNNSSNSENSTNSFSEPPSVLNNEQNSNEIPVFLNIYAPKEQQNQIPLFGVYHSGVEVHNTEYTYSESGIFNQKTRWQPKESPWTYQESIQIGSTSLSKIDINRLKSEMSREFSGSKYNVVSNNCNHFSDSFCQKITGQSIPTWVNRAARWGETASRVTGIDMTQKEKQKNYEINDEKDGFIVNSNLNSAIDIKNLGCLNQQEAHNITVLFKASSSNSTVSLISDSDNQLLMMIPFLKPVNISSIVITSPVYSMPRIIRLFINKHHLDFNDAEEVTPTHIINVNPDLLSINLPEYMKKWNLSHIKRISLPFPPHKFRNVSFLTVFFEENFNNSNQTILYEFSIYGN